MCECSGSRDCMEMGMYMCSSIEVSLGKRLYVCSGSGDWLLMGMYV